MLGNGLGYFSVGAAGTAVSMVNPAAGAANHDRGKCALFIG